MTTSLAAAVNTPDGTGPVDTGPLDTAPVDTAPVDTPPVDTPTVDTPTVRTAPDRTAPELDGPDARSSARLRLRPRHSGPVTGFVDGGWWPRSDDLAAELPALLAQMATEGYQIRRVAYNLEAWDPAPRRLTVAGRVIRLGGFRTQNAAEIDLVDSAGYERTALVVIPPQADPVTAERALVLAATADDTSRADEVLTSTD